MARVIDGATLGKRDRKWGQFFGYRAVCRRGCHGGELRDNYNEAITDMDRIEKDCISDREE